MSNFRQTQNTSSPQRTTLPSVCGTTTLQGAWKHMWAIQMWSIVSLPALVLRGGSGSSVGARIIRFGFGICRRGRSCRSWRATKASPAVYLDVNFKFLIYGSYLDTVVAVAVRSVLCASFRLVWPYFPVDAPRTKYDCIWLYRLRSYHSYLGWSIGGVNSWWIFILKKM